MFKDSTQSISIIPQMCEILINAEISLQFVRVETRQTLLDLCRPVSELERSKGNMNICQGQTAKLQKMSHKCCIIFAKRRVYFDDLVWIQPNSTTFTTVITSNVERSLFRLTCCTMISLSYVNVLSCSNNTNRAFSNSSTYFTSRITLPSTPQTA